MKKWEKTGEFGKMLKNKRQENLLTQESVAESVDCSERQVRNIESGKSEPKIGMALLLCRECGVNTSELETLIPADFYDYGDEKIDNLPLSGGEISGEEKSNGKDFANL